MKAASMWLFVAACAVLGTHAIAAPGSMRRIVRIFLRDMPVRIFGFICMVGGTLLFVFASGTHLPPFVQIMGVVLFIAGGVQIVIPAFAILINEWWGEKSDLWFRFSGIVYLGLAYLFYLASHATGTAPPPTAQ